MHDIHGENKIISSHQSIKLFGVEYILQVPAFVEREHEFFFLAVRDIIIPHVIRLLSSEHPFQFVISFVVLSLRTSTIWKKILLECTFKIQVLNRNQEHIWNFFVTMEDAKGTAKYMQLLQSDKLELVMIKAGRYEIKFGFGL
jgi:hypothetical protein